MLNVENVTALALAHVYQNISEILTLDADLSVFKTLIVIDRKRVLITSVKIHVPEFVELMLNVAFKTTVQYVFV